MKSSMKEEIIDHPKHYTWMNGVEAIDICEQVADKSGWHIANCIKYLLRCDEKHDDNGITDLKKCAFYLQRELERRTRQSLDKTKGK